MIYFFLIIVRQRLEVGYPVRFGGEEALRKSFRGYKPDLAEELVQQAKTMWRSGALISLAAIRFGHGREFLVLISE